MTIQEDKKKLLLDLMEFRSIVEPALVRLATVNASPEAIDFLIKIEAQLEDEYSHHRDTTESDIAFHTVIARCSKNKVVDAVFPVLVKAIPAINKFTEKTLMEDTISDHRSIVQACKDRNHELAELLMLQHIKRNTEFVKHKQKD